MRADIYRRTIRQQRSHMQSRRLAESRESSLLGIDRQGCWLSWRNVADEEVGELNCLALTNLKILADGVAGYPIGGADADRANKVIANKVWTGTRPLRAE